MVETNDFKVLRDLEYVNLTNIYDSVLLFQDLARASLGVTKELVKGFGKGKIRILYTRLRASLPSSRQRLRLLQH